MPTDEIAQIDSNRLIHKELRAPPARHPCRWPATFVQRRYAL